MRRVGALIILILFCAPGSQACGDKYLVRCIANRTDITPEPTEAKGHVVLIDDGSPTIARLLELHIEEELTRRGYRIYVVHTDSELTDLATEVSLDLAIVDAGAVAKFGANLPFQTEALPVFDMRKGHTLPVLDGKYAYSLKVPGEKSTNLLSVDYAVQDARQGL